MPRLLPAAALGISSAFDLHEQDKPGSLFVRIQPVEIQFPASKIGC